MELNQLSGDSKKVSKKLEGKERIFSRKDTKRLFKLATVANDDRGLKHLGKAVYEMIKIQNETPPEFT